MTGEKTKYLPANDILRYTGIIPSLPTPRWAGEKEDYSRTRDESNRLFVMITSRTFIFLYSVQNVTNFETRLRKIVVNIFQRTFGNFCVLYGTSLRFPIYFVNFPIEYISVWFIWKRRTPTESGWNDRLRWPLFIVVVKNSRFKMYSEIQQFLFLFFYGKVTFFTAKRKPKNRCQKIFILLLHYDCSNWWFNNGQWHFILARVLSACFR